MANTERKSLLALAVEQRERKFHEFDVQGIFRFDGQALHRIAIRVPNNAEERSAIDGAHEHVQKRCKTESAKNDPDILENEKTMQILRRVCYEAAADVAEGEARCQVFGDTTWMSEQMTSDELSLLLNMLQEVRRKDTAIRTTISPDDVVALARGCWMARATDFPETALADCDREFMTQAFVLLSCKLAEAMHWTETEEPNEQEDQSE